MNEGTAWDGLDDVPDLSLPTQFGLHSTISRVILLFFVFLGI